MTSQLDKTIQSLARRIPSMTEEEARDALRQFAEEVRKQK